ncbi:nSTAND1 domain-containing NTPase [Microcoleus sp. OTE_8_concoct_300]|uniref:nSTAND1 domain-containing NTPase n=1 Tax=Microcoleus sp. OTE_8_concoct_300 TaxID=2964710 RepID=UPI00403F24E9
MNVFEFEITIQSKSGESSWPIVVRCKKPDGLTIHSKETLQLNQEDLNKLIQQQENEREYGTHLGKALFRGAVYDTFVRALSQSSQDSVLRILLSIEAADNDPIKTLHWERLCAPIDGDGEWHLLARNQRVPFSLYIPTIIDRRFPAIGRRDLRALVLVASPSNIGKFQLAPFDVEAVLSGVKEALGEIPYEILANDVAGAIGPPTLQELSKQLTNAQKPYTLLHFVAHGKLLDNGETVLYWAKADNQVQPVTGEELLSELKNIGNHQRSLPHFTFLCTCESADPRAEVGLGGLGQRLVRNLGMPAVVAMTRKVSVETGLALGQNFYRRLRESGEVDTALQEATAGLSKRHDIAVPALFSRLGGRPLFSDRLDDRELTDEEIEYGMEKLQQLLQERAPQASVLKQRFETQVKALKDTRGAESRTARQERHQAIVELNNLCEQVIEISFDALAALGKQPPGYKAECPFPGLSSFADKKYHKFFFGRDELIRDLQKELAKDNFLAVIGTSGSGKSSVVLAGLIPQLKEQELSLQWAYMTPGKEPLRQLKRRLERLLKVSEHHSILVVDQFEEVFTLCEDQAERVEFIDKLLKFADRRKVVITMRADFLGECTFYPELRKRIETRQKLVGPMEPAELITAMKMQADRGGLRFEAGLSHAILNDVQGEPGAMPLLQYALQELWKRRRGRWLCDEEYQAIGGVQKAIAKTADDFYNSLSVAEQEQVQNIFLRLTRLDASAIPGEKRRDTRRRVELEDLVPTGDDLAVTKKLVQQLAGGGVRLVVTSRNEATGKEEVEVAHEALIRYWPTLQNWLNQNRHELLLRETINQAAQEWQQHQEQPDKDIYLIHQGGRLEDAEVLSKHPKFVQLNQLEAEYVKACVQLRQRRRKLEEQRKQRQLMAAALSALILGGFAIFAGIKWREAEMERIQAFLQSAEARLASNQTLDARIESLRAAKALKQSFWQRLWPEAGLRNEVLGKLSETIYAGQELNHLETPQREVYNIAFSPDGKTLATSGSESVFRAVSTIFLWDTSGKKLSDFKTKQGKVNSVVFSPDGKLLVTAGKDGTARLWDTKGNPLAVLQGHQGAVNSAMFSADGKLIVTAGKDGTARLWDTKGNPLAVLKRHQGEVKSAMFSRDGKVLVTAGKDNTARLWDTKGKQLHVLKGHQGDINSVAFSPDGKVLVTAGDEGITHVWDTSQERSTDRKKHQGEVNSVAFSPDGKLFVSGGQDNTANLWDTARLWDTKGKLFVTLKGHQGDINNVAFSPDGKLLVTVGKDDTVRLWDTTGKPLFVFKMNQGEDKSAMFSPDGKLLVTAGKDDTVRLWDTTGKQLTLLKRHRGEVNSVEFSPDGKLILTGGEDGTARLWDTSGTELKVLKGHKGKVWSVNFSRNGKLIVTGGEDGTARLWDTSGNPLPVLKGHQGKVKSALFSPDSKILVTLGEDGIPRLWETSGKPLKPPFTSPNGKMWSVAFSMDSKFLVTAGEYGLVKWDIWAGKQRASIPKKRLVTSMKFSADSKLAVTAEEDGTVRLWESPSAKRLNVFKTYQGKISSVEFSADSQLLVTAGEDGTARLWDRSSSKKPLAVFKGHQGKVNTAVFSEDGKRIVTAGKDGTVRLWQIGGLDELLSINCNWVRDYLKNPSVELSESDRHLCDGIPPSSSPKK